MAATKLKPHVEAEIQRLASEYGYDEAVLTGFAQFVLTKEPTTSKTKAPKKPSKPKPLTLPQLKQAVYSYFEVRDTTELKKSSAFQLATSSIEKLDLSKKPGWEAIYRKVIGVLPGEESETGYGCVNGINIFKYDMPWKAFGLDPKTSGTDEVKQAYRELSKIYHPDARETGDAEIFDRLTVFYKSLTEKF